MRSPTIVLALAAGLAGCAEKANLLAQEDRAVPPISFDNAHADPAAGIDLTRNGGLRLAWKIDTKSYVTHRPLEEHGRVYVADWSGAVTAADLKSGAVVWQKQVERPNTEAVWHGFCGTGAIGDGLLFQASAEGNAFALDVRSGELRWKARLCPEEKYGGNCGAILYADGRVYIGVSSTEEGVVLNDKTFTPKFRGRVVALDARSGEKVWELPLVEPPGNGVAVWGGFALDVVANTLYFATGNNYTGTSTSHSDAIVAADARTGKIRWARQATKHDVWTLKDRLGPDYDFGTGPQLFEVGGRQLVGAGQKSGAYVVLDRLTSEPVWTAVVGYGEIAGGIMADASVGGGRIYVWSNNSYDPAKREAEKTPMTVQALDAASGARVWSVPQAMPAGGNAAGFLSKDAYFVGSLDGRIRAYAVRDGKPLWTSPEGDASVGASLSIADGVLLVGRGVPKMFGGNAREAYGLWAYVVAGPVGR